jgi:hypothetical protein
VFVVTWRERRTDVFAWTEVWARAVYEHELQFRSPGFEHGITDVQYA